MAFFQHLRTVHPKVLNKNPQVFPFVENGKANLLPKNLTHYCPKSSIVSF